LRVSRRAFGAILAIAAVCGPRSLGWADDDDVRAAAAKVKAYRIGETKDRQFLDDGWSASALPRGQVGVVDIGGENGTLTVELGSVPQAAQLTEPERQLMAETLDAPYRSFVADYLGGKPAYFQPGPPSVESLCVLKFEGGVLRSVEWKTARPPDPPVEPSRP
jgi:hypothetical protein